LTEAFGLSPIWQQVHSILTPGPSKGPGQSEPIIAYSRRTTEALGMNLM